MFEKGFKTTVQNNVSNTIYITYIPVHIVYIIIYTVWQLDL